jgi:hypothetical protein
MLAIAIGQTLGFFYIMIFSIYPSYAKDSAIGKKIAEIKRHNFVKWDNELKKSHD